MNLHCPCCHARFPFEAALEDEAGRELLGLLAQVPGPLVRPLVGYLGLFRAHTRALSWDRALRLAQEALALTPDRVLLAEALAETVEAIRAKGETRPLANHNYLRRVLESARARGPQISPIELGLSPAKESGTAGALRRLDGMKDGA